jgi:uncharacterized protein
MKDPEDQRQPRFCEAYIHFFEHADGRMKILAQNWMKKQSDLQEKESTRGNYWAFQNKK